jgi:hypothetical protein
VKSVVGGAPLGRNRVAQGTLFSPPSTFDIRHPLSRRPAARRLRAAGREAEGKWEREREGSLTHGLRRGLRYVARHGGLTFDAKLRRDDTLEKKLQPKLNFARWCSG